MLPQQSLPSQSSGPPGDQPREPLKLRGLQLSLCRPSQRRAEGQSGSVQPDACKQPLHLATREVAQRAGHRLHPEQEQPDAVRHRLYVWIIARSPSDSLAFAQTRRKRPRGWQRPLLALASGDRLEAGFLLLLLLSSVPALSRMAHNAKGALLALLSFALFASHDVVVKFLGGSYAPFQIVFFSVLFSFPLVSLMLIRDTTPGHLRPIHPWWTALRTVSAVITGICVFYAFSVLPLAQTYAILFAQPLVITVLAIPILGERVRLRRWIAVLVGLAGVIVVLRPGGTELSLGHAAALVGACSGALAAIVVRKIGHEERSVVLLLYPMLTNFVIMACALPFVYQPMPIEHLGAVGVMAVLAIAGGFVLIGAYRNGEAVIVAPMQYSQLLWATLYGALFFDEWPDAMTLAGAVLIIGSGVYIVLRESRSTASENTPVLRTRTRFETGTSLRIGPLLRALGRREKTLQETPQ